MESTGHLQPVLPLVRRDCELFPHTVESGQRVPRGAGGTTQRLAQHHCGLQQLAAVIIGALKTEKGNGNCEPITKHGLDTLTSNNTIKNKTVHTKKKNMIIKKNKTFIKASLLIRKMYLL